jgi:hypothetical protein
MFVMMKSVLTSFSFASLSWVLHDYPNHVYANNLSCIQNIDLMTCEKQQNGLGSSDGSGSSNAAENEVDLSTSVLCHKPHFYHKTMKFRL